MDASGDPDLTLAGAGIMAFGEADGIGVIVGGTDAANETIATTVGLLFPVYLAGGSGGIQGYRVWEVMTADTTTLGTEAVGTSLAALGSMASTDLMADTYVATPYGGIGTSPYILYGTTQGNVENEVVFQSRGATHLLVHTDIGTAASAFVFARRLRIGSEG